MTAAAVMYDSNYSVPMHVHRPSMDSLAGGTELVCEICGGHLRIVCENGCPDPLEKVRKSRGPVPPAPTSPEPKRKRAPNRPRTRERTPKELRQLEIGHTLREAMRARGITEEQLGADLGRTKSTVICWVTGNFPIPRQFVAPLAQRFELPESALINELHLRKR